MGHFFSGLIQLRGDLISDGADLFLTKHVACHPLDSGI